VLDLARVFPPEAPLHLHRRADGALPVLRGTHLVHLLRPEAVQQATQALSSDAFTAFGHTDDGSRTGSETHVHNQRVWNCTRRVHSEFVERLTTWMVQQPLEVPRSYPRQVVLSSLMHSMGINCRHFGRVLQSLSTRVSPRQKQSTTSGDVATKHGDADPSCAGVGAGADPSCAGVGAGAGPANDVDACSRAGVVPTKSGADAGAIAGAGAGAGDGAGAADASAGGDVGGASMSAENTAAADEWLEVVVIEMVARTLKAHWRRLLRHTVEPGDVPGDAAAKAVAVEYVRYHVGLGGFLGQVETPAAAC